MNQYSKVLITGATGFAGGEILRYLSIFYDKKHLFGTGRNFIKINKLREEGYQMIPGDLTDEQFVKSNFGHITDVIHCAAKSDIWGAYDSFYANNVIATENILSIPNLKKFIYISTPSIYFNYKDRLNIKESDTISNNFVNYYSKTKYLGEGLVQNHTQADIKKYIFRPRAIIGVRDNTLMPRLMRAFNEGRLKIVGSGKNIGDFTSVKNLAHIIHLALEKENQTDQIVFNVTDDNPVNLWDFINNSLVKLKLSPITKKVPYSLAYIVANINEWYNILFLKSEPALTRYGLAVLKYSLLLNLDAAKEQLGYKPIINSDQSIDEFVKWKKYDANKDSNFINRILYRK